MTIHPIYGGHTTGGQGSTSLDLLNRTTELITQVTEFSTTVRDFRAPPMDVVSTLPATTIAERGALVDINA